MKLRSFLESKLQQSQQPNITIAGMIHIILYGIKKHQAVVCQRPKLKPPDIYVSCYWEVGFLSGSFFFCSLLLGKKKIKILQLILCNWKKKSLFVTTVCYQSAPPEFPKIITTARQPAPKSLDNKGSQPAM